MTVALNKQIKIDQTVITFNDLVNDPISYLPIISTKFRATTLRQKDGETDLHYYSRLFGALYYRKGYGYGISESVEIPRSSRARASRVSDTDDGCRILSALGIDVVKQCAKTSKVLFKSSKDVYRMNNTEMSKLIDSLKSHKTYTRSNVSIKFGVELEFIGERGHIPIFTNKMNKLVKNKFDAPLNYNHNDGAKWVLGTDTSLHVTESNHRGYELTSRILDFSSEKDMQELKNVIELVITTFGAYTNRSCGTHIHVSFDCGDYAVTRDLCRHFARSYRKSEEPLFDKLVPKYRRGSSSRWCNRADEFSLSDRYRKINFKNVNLNSGNSNMHLEFRQLDGTLDYNKIVSWLKLQKIFIELALGSYKLNSEDVNSDTVEIKLEEIVCDKEFNVDDVESLLKMSKLAV